MHIEFRQEKVISLNESINVNEGEDETFIGTGCVFVNSEVGLKVSQMSKRGRYSLDNRVPIARMDTHTHNCNVPFEVL